MSNVEESNELQIEVPVNLLPDLEAWGIDSAEPGICLDTFDNRAKLREHDSKWESVYDSNGQSTPYIQAITAEMRQARLVASKRPILTKPNDPDSPYLTGFDLIIESEARNTVPAWVLAATRKWLDVEEEREKRKLDGNHDLFRPDLQGPPTRCLATTMAGHRCSRWANGSVTMNGLCKDHVKTQRYDHEEIGTATITTARNRLREAAIRAVEGLEELATSATSEPVRLGAYRELLDRGGLRGGVEIETNVNVTVSDAADLVKKRLETLRENHILETARLQEAEPEIIEAEVVENDDH